MTSTSELIFAMAACLAACAAPAESHAQGSGSWSGGIGAIVTNTKGDFGDSRSAGGLARVNYWTWTRDGVSLGVDMRVAVLDHFGGDCVRVGFGPPDCVRYAYVMSMYGVGASFQLSHPLADGRSVTLRGVVGPQWGRTTNNPPPENTASPFAAWFGGIAVGAGTEHWRVEAEGGIVASVHQHRPSMFSLQVAWSP